MCATIVQTEVLGEKSIRAKGAISMGRSLQYKIIWRSESSVLNWQTIPSHLFVQPLSIYLRFQIFDYKIPLSSGFVCNTWTQSAIGMTQKG